MPKLIAITGMDGCGKSSIIDKLLIHFPNSTAAEIWNPLYRKESLFKSKKEVDDYICSLSQASRLHFLSHAILESTQREIEKDLDIVFLGAYYYKYFASELALGASIEMVDSIINYLPKPDLTIRLKLPVDLVVERKTVFSKYECGLNPDASKDSFIDFQKKCESKWEHFKDSVSVEIQNDGFLEETYQQVLKSISVV